MNANFGDFPRINPPLVANLTKINRVTADQVICPSATTTAAVPRSDLQENVTMMGFVGDIEKLTKENDLFRKVLYTGQNIQLVLMALKPGEEIGSEVHEDIDQFFRFETGEGEVWIDGKPNKIGADDGVIVPAGAEHNVVNTGSDPLRLYTIYGPPEHLDGTVHTTKAEAEASHEHFDGRTTE